MRGAATICVGDERDMLNFKRVLISRLTIHNNLEIGSRIHPPHARPSPSRCAWGGQILFLINHVYLDLLYESKGLLPSWSKRKNRFLFMTTIWTVWAMGFPLSGGLPYGTFSATRAAKLPFPGWAGATGERRAIGCMKSTHPKWWVGFGWNVQGGTQGVKKGKWRV